MRSSVAQFARASARSSSRQYHGQFRQWFRSYAEAAAGDRRHAYNFTMAGTARARRGLDRFELLLDGEVLVVASMPDRGRTAPDLLTKEERSVALDVIAGMRNAAIAKKRNRSSRTVANQLASIYRKLRVGSRVQLVARVLGDG